MKSSKKTPWRWIISAAVLAVLLGMIALTYHQCTYVEEGTQVEGIGWLPKSARDITYYRTIFVQEATFRIPEADFAAFAKSQGAELREVAGTEYFGYSFINRQARLALQGDMTVEQYEKEAHFTVKNGLAFEKIQPNGGGLVFAYNRVTGMGYYRYAHR